MPVRRYVAVVMLGCLPLGCADNAFAQSAPGRPYRALFGGATTDPSMHQAFDVTFAVVEAYDDNVLAESGLPTSALQLSGRYTGLAPSASFAWKGRHAEFYTIGGSSFRYYESAQKFVGTTHFGSARVAVTHRRTQVTASQTISYSPSYFYGLLPSLIPLEAGVPAGAGGDFSVNDQNAYFVDGGVNLSQGIRSRSTVTFLANYRRTNYVSTASSQDLRSYGVGGRYTYNLTKNAALRLGYIYRGGQYVNISSPTVVHDVDVGVDYRRPLSFSRRTHLDFSVGSALVNAPELPGRPGGLQYRVVGSAGLSHDMRRTWRTRVFYNRGAGFAVGFSQPVFSDALTTSVEGFFSRRVDFRASGGVAIGAVGITSNVGNDFRTYTANTQLRIAINPVWAITGEYLYYKYDFGSAVVSVPVVAQKLDRNSVRLGLTLWLPLVRR